MGCFPDDDDTTEGMKGAQGEKEGAGAPLAGALVCFAIGCRHEGGRPHKGRPCEAKSYAMFFPSGPGGAVEWTGAARRVPWNISFVR